MTDNDVVYLHDYEVETDEYSLIVNGAVFCDIKHVSGDFLTPPHSIVLSVSSHIEDITMYTEYDSINVPHEIIKKINDRIEKITIQGW